MEHLNRKHHMVICIVKNVAVIINCNQTNHLMISPINVSAVESLNT